MHRRVVIVIVAALFLAPLLARPSHAGPSIQNVTVKVTESGYVPDSVTLKSGQKTRMTFIRETDGTCATTVLIPEYKIKKDLPLKKAVTVEFTPKKSGTYAFTCGMGMMKGKLVVK